MRSKIGIAARALPSGRLRGALLALPVAILTACGGGGGGGSSAGSAQVQSLDACALPAAVCTGIQLGGAVTGASVTVTPLLDPVTLVEQGRTPSLEDVRLADGAEQWDRRADIEKLRRLGQFANDDRQYEPGELYLVRASGGEDQDANADNDIDVASAQVAAAATGVLGEWHAILPGDLVGAGNVTPLTEAVYRYLETDLADLSFAEIRNVADALAARIVGDVDASGSVNYADLLAWDRHTSPGFYLYNIAAVNELADAVRGNATLATIRQLSLAVLQVSGTIDQTYTLRGSIAVPPTHRVDGDVNNPAAPFTDNGSPGAAQPVDNPLVLGGYANVPGEGFGGRSQSGGDTDDFYSMSLGAGQVLSLVMADSPDANDLDLYLYDSNGSLIDASLGVNGVEQITVQADGDYLVRVNAWEDPANAPQVVTATNYQLSVGVSAQALRQQSLTLSDDFVPGEIIARFRDTPRVDSLPRRARLTGMRVRGGGLRRANLLQMDAVPGESLTRRKLRTLRALKRLRQQEDIESAGLNYRVQAAAVPNDPFFFQQWHYDLLNLRAAWENPRRGDGVIVAVVDSGVRTDHPDLQSQLQPGYDFFDDDSNPMDPGDSTDGSRSSFHGTHVAGTVAAASNNGRGVAGVAWNAQIMPLRVLGPGGGTSYDVLQAVRYAAGLENDSGIQLSASQRADVINLSLAGGGFNSFEQQLYNDVANLGIITVAAAGNDNSSAFAYPASYDGVISVSAVNQFRDRATYSNFGSAVDVAAPGGDNSAAVLSTGADDSGASVQLGYTLLIGTSMATPHVSGTLALMKSIYPELTVRDVEELLSQGLLTTDLGATGRDNFYGWGLIDAKNAVDVAQGLADGVGPVLEPTVCTSTSELNFGNFAIVLPLSVTNCGSGTLVINNILPGDPWVSIAPNAVDSNGVGRYTVQIDRSQLPVGRNFSTLDIRTNDRNISVQVVVEQPEPGTLATGDAGVHYILLLDAVSGAVVQEVEVSAVDGVYNYEFTNVPAGLYEIIGGSDADNDLFVCDPGEACGAWPALDSSQPEIEVHSDVENLDFTTSFNDGIISTQQLGGPAGQTGRENRRSAYRGPNGER